MPFFIKVDTASHLMYEFKKVGRETHFSHTALEKILELHEAIDLEPSELDVVELVCTYSEDELRNVLKSYGLKSREELEEKTWVESTDGTMIVYAIY